MVKYNNLFEKYIKDNTIILKEANIIINNL